MIRILLSTRLGERKWTQADLVRETGIRASTINDLYHEMTDRVSLEQLDQICKALDCDINEILVREEKIDERTPAANGPRPGAPQITLPLAGLPCWSGFSFTPRFRLKAGFQYQFCCRERMRCFLILRI